MPLEPSNNLTELGWNDLIHRLHSMLDMEWIRLERNKAYYTSEFNKSGADLSKLEKLYNRINEEQNRNQLIEEFLMRIEEQNMLAIFQSLDFCIQSEKMRTGKEPDNFEIYINKVNRVYKTYYLPLK